MDSKPHLAIIGSGWAGFYLVENIDFSLYSVTLISPRRTLAYTPLLASAAVGLFNFSLAEESVRSRRRRDLEFLKANVLNIDFDAKVCTCMPAFDEKTHRKDFEVNYDFLVIAPGCVPNTFGTPGVEEHALFMKNVSDAMAFRKKLFDLLELASLPNITEEEARALLHIVVVGGGPTGVEFTAELHDLCKRELKDLYPRIADYMSISIYDVAPHILNAYDKSLNEYATNKLTEYEIDVEPDTHIKNVDDNSIHIEGKGAVPYGILIWATGNKNAPLIDTLGDRVRVPDKGLKRILTDDRLRVLKPGNNNPAYDFVFAIGDAGDVDGASLPTTAEVAVQKAKYLVDNFNRMSQDQPGFLTPFAYQQRRLVTYIGSHDGVIAGKGPDDPGWTGRSAWLSWRSGSIMWNQNWRSRVAIVLTWALNSIFGRDVTKL